jgi:hypothetical protein
MSDAWFAIVDATGECRSLGTRVADPLPAGLEAVALSPSDAESLLDGSGVWVASARAVRPVVAPVPDSITPWQLHTWLWQRRGVTQAHVAGLLATLPNAQREQAEIDLQNALSFRRGHPLVTTFGAALGMTEAEIDDAFREAARLA